MQNLLEKIKTAFKIAGKKIKAFFECIKNILAKFWDGIQNWFTKNFITKANVNSEESPSKNQNEKTEASESENSAASVNEKTATTTRLVASTRTSIPAKIFSNIFDYIGSLLILCAVIFAIKPVLIPGINEYDVPQFIKKVGKIGGYIVRFEILERGESDFLFKRNALVLIFLLLFLLFKTLVILLRKEIKKPAGFLLLTMTLFNFFILSDKFFFFLIFMILIFFAFEYSAGFGNIAIAIKSILIATSVIAIYIALHFIANPTLSQEYAEFIANFAIRIKSWW